MYVTMGVHRIVGSRIYVNYVVVDGSIRRIFALIMLLNRINVFQA